MQTRARRADENPESITFRHERRQLPRHLPRTPAYASVSDSSQAAITDRNGIRDISSGGACIEFAASKQTGRLLPLCLELSETGTRIYVVSHVVWSEESGKTGIRFPDLPEFSRSQLEGWIRTDGRAANAAMSVSPGSPAEPEIFWYASALAPAAADVWAEIEKKCQRSGPDLQVLLDLIVQQALQLTSAHGAAIALSSASDPAEMFCRARAGTDSPGIGARLQSESGFSGECVRSGEPIICVDAECDTRVDQESCRALGVRSIVAAPIKCADQTIGVIEVFSPKPENFDEEDVVILQRLAVLIGRAVQRANDLGADQPSADEAMNNPASALDQLEAFKVAPSRGIALISAGVFLVIAVALAFALTVPRSGKSTTPNVLAADPSPSEYATLAVSGLTTRANQGDAQAQYALAMRYANGSDVEQDYREARQWFLSAAEQGHVGAQEKVAIAFWEGKGGAQDYSKAYFWAALAQAGGDEISKQIVMSCAARLSPVQIAAERKQADQWLHSHHIGHAAE